MKKNQIMKVALVAGLLVVGNNVTYAQFGKLLNKAKVAAKKGVDDAKLDAKNSARRTVKETAEEKAAEAKEEASGKTWEWDNNHPENVTNGYEIANAGEWNAESDYTVICADLAYRLMNIYKLDEYVYVTRHSPSFESVMRAKLNVISGLAHASGMSSFNDGVTDQKQKDILENWQRELIRVIGNEQSLVNSGTLNSEPGYGGNSKAFRRFGQMVDQIEVMQTKKDKARAFNMAYNMLENGIMSGNIKGTEAPMGELLGKMDAVYQMMPAHLHSYYADEMTFDKISALAKQRQQVLADIASKSSADRSVADAKYRKDFLLSMYKDAQSAGRYVAMPAAKGNATEKYIKQYVEERYPEWGTILRVSAPMNYNVHRDKLGNIKYRSHNVTVVCQDQGYKAVHYISMHEQYVGSKYTNGLPNSDRWNFGPLYLVK